MIEWYRLDQIQPDPGERVLVSNGKFVCEAYMMENHEWVRSGCHMSFMVPTYWAPMPEGPGASTCSEDGCGIIYPDETQELEVDKGDPLHLSDLDRRLMDAGRVMRMTAEEAFLAIGYKMCPVTENPISGRVAYKQVDEYLNEYRVEFTGPAVFPYYNGQLCGITEEMMVPITKQLVELRKKETTTSELEYGITPGLLEEQG